MGIANSLGLILNTKWDWGRVAKINEFKLNFIFTIFYLKLMVNALSFAPVHRVGHLKLTGWLLIMQFNFLSGIDVLSLLPKFLGIKIRWEELRVWDIWGKSEVRRLKSMYSSVSKGFWYVQHLNKGLEIHLKSKGAMGTPN